jgi:hypothetical protein
MGNQATAERKPAIQRLRECREELGAGVTLESTGRAKRVIEDIEDEFRDGTLTLRGGDTKADVLSFLAETKQDIARAEHRLRKDGEAAEKAIEEERRRRAREALIDRNLKQFIQKLEEQIQACEKRIESNEERIGRLSSIPKESRDTSQNIELATRTENSKNAITERDELVAKLKILQTDDGEANWRAKENKELGELKEQTKQQATQKAEEQRRAETDLKQLMESATLVGLSPVYDVSMYGEAVIELLRAGLAAGKRIPDDRDLTRVAQSVHNVAGKGGFSSADSTSNGLVNRIRAESLSVVERAHGLGYNIDDAAVQAAMAALARSVAMAQDSDSGGRNEKKEHLSRGMTYFTGSKDRAQVDLNWEDEPDPQQKLKKLRNAESIIKYQLSNLRDQGQREVLEKQLKSVRAQIKELEELT